MSYSDSDSDIYSNESIDDLKGKEIIPKLFFNKKELCYYTMADKFFKTKCEKDYIDMMIDIITLESDISLRVLDWFAAKYSKNRNKLNFVGGETDEFDVRISYDAQLRTFRKKYFDPFRRKKKFYYYYDKNDKKKKILTTIGQLNFFKWAIDKKILDFVKINLEQINKEMKVCTTEEKKKKICKLKKTSIKDENNEKSDEIKVKSKNKIVKKETENEDEEDIELVLNFM